MSVPKPPKSYRPFAEDHSQHSLHKRSRSELIGHSYSKPTLPKDLRLVTEESSSGVSESELIIRRIIAESGNSRRGTPSDNVDLAAGLQLVQQEIETERRKTAGRKRTIRQQVLHLVSVGSRTEEWSLSPEPRAQFVPIFKPIKKDNRPAVRAAIDLIETTKERLDLLTALNACPEVSFFLIVFETREVTGVRGVYGWIEDTCKRLWGKGEDILAGKGVDICYRFAREGFRVLPHNRLSRAIDGVVLL